MGKPNTRSKFKRQKIEENEDLSFYALRNICLTGEVSQDDMRVLYMIDKPYCQGCRVNSKDSPNCFCALVPSSSSSRKSGLWQKLTDNVEGIGPDPCQHTRSSTEIPAGLTNLGATCYVNSILQCLYMNISFRNGVFSAEPELVTQQAVLNKLAHLFAGLHSSRMAFVDSAPFINTLELDNTAQQDCHEFLTLFLSLLEQSLGNSKVPKARTIVQDLFCGSMSHVSRCSVCGKESDAASQRTDFYGLLLNVKGLNDLEESLDDYFKAEELQGENQYFCESCQKYVDATRSVMLHALPSVLNFQLKRYVFNAKTNTKKKLSSAFSFPRRLNMTKRLSDSSKLDSVYELTAILIHKGSTVSSGHYLAHIKHEQTGQWWEFDDENVSEMGSSPFGGVSLGSNKSKAQIVAQAVPSNNEHSISDSDLPNNTEVFSSADAYLLMYRRQCAEKIGTGGIGLGVNDSDVLPAYLFDEVNLSNALLDISRENYETKKQAQLENIKGRREEVRSLIPEFAVQSSDDPFFWVSTEWLRLWADAINPQPIDNTTILCEHNRVPLSNIFLMKRLSEKAWHTLLGKYGGGPELNHDDFCVICLKKWAKSKVSAINFKELRSSMVELAEAALAGNCSDDHMYYVSKTWLLHWVRRKNNDCPSDTDAGPTAALSCPHGGLLPEQAAGAKRVLVPDNLWIFFLENAKAVQPDDPSGRIPFSMESDSCAICCVELTEMASLKNDLRGEKLRQRQNHEKLFQGKNIPLYPGSKYFLLPSSWLNKWRSYIASGKNAASHLEPDLLTVIKSLICEKHSHLLERPPQLTCKRGLITQKPSMDGLSIISESDWEAFCEEWNVPIEKGVTAEIYYVNSDDICRSSDGMPTLEEEIDPAKTEVKNDSESTPAIRTYPETCEVCIDDRETSNLVQKLNYCNEKIQVFFICGGEVPRSVLEAGNSFNLDRRTSKRTRRTSSGNSVSLQVSGSTTFYQLKMMIWETFGIVKENQKVHKGTRELEGENATLADMNIFAGDVLWVSDSEIHENRDIADELSEQKMEQQPKEEGFRGTLLVRNMTSQDGES